MPTAVTRPGFPQTFAQPSWWRGDAISPRQPIARPAIRSRTGSRSRVALRSRRRSAHCYSPNITPDKQTGIGAWSDAEFLRAVHEGIGRDGKRLYPAFPYEAYTYLTDEDVLAIKAYLLTLAPVTSVPPQNELSFPFNQRWMKGKLSAF